MISSSNSFDYLHYIGELNLPTINVDESFGFYYDEEDKCGSPMSLASEESSRSQDSLATNSTSSSIDTYRCSRRPNEELHVTYKVEDESAPSTIRYFHNGSTAIVSIQGFRIVKDEEGEEPEYLVKLNINDKVYSAWRRYSDFEELAEACASYYLTAPSRSSSNNCEEDEIDSFLNTLRAWYAVERNRSGSDSFNVKLVVSETTLLKAFMKYLVFETPSLELLIAFTNSS